MQATLCVIIEHNLDVIKTADWLIDMGSSTWAHRHGFIDMDSERGDGGVVVVGVGTPETLAENTESYTGRYSKPMLKALKP